MDVTDQPTRPSLRRMRSVIGGPMHPRGTAELIRALLARDIRIMVPHQWVSVRAKFFILAGWRTRPHNGLVRPCADAQPELRARLAPQRQSPTVGGPARHRDRAFRCRAAPQSPRRHWQLDVVNRRCAFLRSALRHGRFPTCGGDLCECKSALNRDPTPKPRKVLIYIAVFLQAGSLDRRRSRPLLDRVFPQHIHGFVGSQAGSLLDADPQRFFYTASEPQTGREPQLVLTTDNDRFTVIRARLAPAMISTPGH